jgi:hypothetical protein
MALAVLAPKIALETARKNVAVVVDLNEVILALGTRDLLGFTSSDMARYHL